MPEQLSKLSPHRDLQCYFLTPSAIAAMSNASASGFTVSGKWRQQFDWAVVEWNRDNVFEHPSLRYLPDSDLSSLKLSYTDQRTGCIPFESNLFPTVDWDKLRVWVSNADGTETVYYIPLSNYMTAIGNYVSATGGMTLVTLPASGQRVGLAMLQEHYYYTVASGDSLASVAEGIANAINLGSTTFVASASNATVNVTWSSNPNNLYKQLSGANGNRISMYGFSQGTTQCWLKPSATFSGGQFPLTYQVNLDFSNLHGWSKAGDTNPLNMVLVPFNNVRKIRWTWSADLQSSSFEQTEFEVLVTNWNVTGTDRSYFVAGPGSRRIEENDSSLVMTGFWESTIGNYSGSRIAYTSESKATCALSYAEPAGHTLYLGTRLLSGGSTITAAIDGGDPQVFHLNLSTEDVLVRLKLGVVGAGNHSVVLTNVGDESNTTFYFDFLEIAYPSANLVEVVQQSKLALATDWDTYHSQSLPAERTAWMIDKLGFGGRVNHYTGALWFYEMNRPGMQYASLTLDLSLKSGSSSSMAILDIGAQAPNATQIQHLILPDESPATLAQAFACLINLGSNAVWAAAQGSQLVLTARAMGKAGNGSIYVSVDAQSGGFDYSAPSTVLGGGVDGTPYELSNPDVLQELFINNADQWCTDLTARPTINRAARDWHQAYYTALHQYGLDVVASFSTELGNGDISLSAGIAQRYPDGTPVLVNTPAVQTNFAPATQAYWTQVYLDMASIQVAAGLVPYLQSGEVQWWYFPKRNWTADGSSDANVGMTFYDAYTQQQFESQYGRSMRVILENTVDPNLYPEEVAFLPTLIGAYTAGIRSTLQTMYPAARYEVLYPPDTNDTPLNQLINFPNADWTRDNLDCLKTESFTFTNNRNLDQSLYSMNVSAVKGFPNQQRSHLVGIGDSWTAWMKEVDLAVSQGMESVVLFALDQYCLIGYPSATLKRQSRSAKLG